MFQTSPPYRMYLNKKNTFRQLVYFEQFPILTSLDWEAVLADEGFDVVFVKVLFSRLFQHLSACVHIVDVFEAQLRKLKIIPKKDWSLINTKKACLCIRISKTSYTNLASYFSRPACSIHHACVFVALH